MPETGTAAGMLSIIFDEVSDISYTMAAAPVPDLFREVLLHQSCHRVHVLASHPRSRLSVCRLFPQKRELKRPVPAPACPEPLFQFSAPWQVFLFIQSSAGLIDMSVADLRFIGKESEDGPAELFGIMLPVGFIDRINQGAAGLVAEHVHVIPVRAPVPCQIESIHSPGALSGSPADAFRVHWQAHA